MTALTKDEYVEFAGDSLAAVVVAAAIPGSARPYQVEAVMPSVRAGMISKGVNP